MIKRILLALLGFFMIFFGLGVIEIGATDPQYAQGDRVGAYIAGACVIVGGIVLIIYHGSILIDKYKKSRDKFLFLFCIVLG